ncbi:hypothetical protein FOL47_005006 [Perkinsus chesapeaki]|uniref:Uncharacterized protein n=1 Tax=Perkinsus chesapeaki TaxID=330153 RepID=A0A7J6LZI3_PERCH|nr:hypothetical protein FOL47_005006 [Perkinsus chesapeaki]
MDQLPYYLGITSLNRSAGLYTASLGSVATVGLLTPLDVIKNMIQGSPDFNNRRLQYGMMDAGRHVVRLLGPKGLWTGIIPSLTIAVPSNLAFLTLYEHYRRERYPVEWAAAKSSMWVVFFSQPLEFLRTRVQAWAGYGTPGYFNAFATVFYEDTFVSYWRGLLVTLMRDVPFAALFWSNYEKGKQLLLPIHVERRGTAKWGSKREKLELAERFADAEATEGSAGMYGEVWGYSFLNAATCGAIAAIATHPFDVMKTQLQSHQRATSRNNFRIYRIHNTWTCAKALYEQYGWKGFTLGIVPRTARIMLASGLLFSTYELCHALIDDLELEELRRVVSRVGLAITVEREASHRIESIAETIVADLRSGGAKLASENNDQVMKLADKLFELVASNFQMALEDGSDEDVAFMLIRLWESCSRGDLSVAQEVMHATDGRDQAKVLEQCAEEGSSGEDEEGDESVPKLVEAKPEPEIDEDGFQTVTKGRRRH